MDNRDNIISMKRKPKPERRVLSVVVTETIANQLDALADSLGERRSMACRMALRAGLTKLAADRMEAS